MILLILTALGVRSNVGGDCLAGCRDAVECENESEIEKREERHTFDTQDRI